MESVSLIERKNDKFAVYLSANINKDGDLVLEGQDLGSGVEEHWGDSDYEYWVVVSAANKFNVISQLMSEVFSNLAKLSRWLISTDIRFTSAIGDVGTEKFSVDADKNQILVLNDNGTQNKELAIDRNDEDKLLLLLLQYVFTLGIFKNDSDFMEWLKQNNIKYQFHSYA